MGGAPAPHVLVINGSYGLACPKPFPDALEMVTPAAVAAAESFPESYEMTFFALPSFWS